MVSPLICDPNSEEAQALLGSKVYFGDYVTSILDREKRGEFGILTEIKVTEAYPFQIDGVNQHYTIIKRVDEENPQREMTMEEVNEFFLKVKGYGIKIVEKH